MIQKEFENSAFMKEKKQENSVKDEQNEKDLIDVCSSSEEGESKEISFDFTEFFSHFFAEINK